MIVIPDFEDMPLSLSGEGRVLFRLPEHRKQGDLERYINPDEPWAPGTILNPHEEFKKNSIIDNGRKNAIQSILNFGAPVTYAYMAVGSNPTASAPTDTGPITELTGNATRIGITNSTGGALSTGDWIVSISGAFRWKLVVQGEFLDTDGNNGSVFSEFSLANQAAFGGGSSFYNRFVLGTSFTKSAIDILMQFILRV